MEPSVVIETKRLRLVTLSESDITELVPLIGDRRVAATTLRIPHPFTENDAREFLNSPAKEYELRMGVRLREKVDSLAESGCILTRSTSVRSLATGLAFRTGAKGSPRRRHVRW